MFAVDLFSGAGGMSLGAKMAGIDVLLSIEMNQYAAETYSHNHPGVDLFPDDIRKIREIEVSRRKRPLLVFGGPPCQGFSTSNQKTRSSENPKNWLFREFMRVVKSVVPDWVVFENVKGILETEGGRFHRLVTRGLSDLGYTCTHGILDAADFGVPQHRWRLFIVGAKAGRKVCLPRPNGIRKVTVQEAIADLPELPNGASDNWQKYRTDVASPYAKRMRGRLKSSANHLVTDNAPYVIERYRHIPKGGNWENIPEELMGNYRDRTRCHTGIYRRLRDDEPAVTIGNFRKNMLIHPWEDRGLSVREAARLQSFPDSYEFKGSIGFQQQQVGDAVPPLLSKAVFMAVIKAAESANGKTRK